MQGPVSQRPVTTRLRTLFAVLFVVLLLVLCVLCVVLFVVLVLLCVVTPQSTVSPTTPAQNGHFQMVAKPFKRPSTKWQMTSSSHSTNPVSGRVV